MLTNPELYPWISMGAIAWGLLDCFFGYRVFKVTLAVVGGLLGVIFGHAAATGLGFGSGGQIGAALACGLVGAGLAYMLYIAAVFVAGFGFGATLGVLLLSNYNHMAALLSAGVLGLIGGFLAIKLQRVLIILSTALLGSFRAMLALTYFINRIDWLYYYQKPHAIPDLIEQNTWMLPVVLALAAVGTLAQFNLGRAGSGKKTSRAEE